jgi:LuxR family maltose regulon positive regulatory protein
MPKVDAKTSLLLTKLYPPPLTEDYIPRQRLGERLKQVDQRPLTLVSAPAGYGKSTLLSAWLNEWACPGIWLSLDERDNDLGSFAGYMVAAIRTLYPIFGEKMLAILDGAIIPNASTYVQMLCTELESLEEGIVLILDDYGSISSDDVHAFIEELLRHPHPHIHLVLLTRHDPPLPLSDWRARNLIVEIRSHELRFSLEETTRFLQQAMDGQLDEAMIAILNDITEGWAAGLRLAALSFLHKGDLQEQIGKLDGSNMYIAEYLVSQVLTRLPAETQTFILQSSILDQFSAPLCQAVVALDFSLARTQKILQELSRDNIFTVALDNRGEWFRYHQLFQQFLQLRLADENSATDVAALHNRASAWFAENGLIEDALKHAFSAGNMDAAVEMVAANRQDMMNQEHHQRLARWLKMFPQEIIDNSPDLLLLQGRFAQILRFDAAELSRVIARVDSLVPRLQLEAVRAQRLLAENDALRSAKYYFAMEPLKAQLCCQNALGVLPLAWYSLRSYCWIYGAVALQMSGDLSGAYEWIARAQREDLKVRDGPQARNTSSAGFVGWIAADLRSMQNVGEHMLEIISGDSRQQSHGWAHYFLACVHYHRNELDRAERHARQVFDRRYTNHSRASIYSAFILALIEHARGKPEAVQAMTAEVSALAAEIRSTPFTIMVQSFRAELAVQQGQAQEVYLWAEQAYAHMQLSVMPFFYAPQMTIPKVMIAANMPGSLVLAADCLQQLHELAESTFNVRILIEVLALEALVHFAQGDKETALSTMKRSLSLALPGGFIRLYVDLGEKMAELLWKMQNLGQFSEYIAAILSAFPDITPVETTPDQSRQLVEPMTDREEEILILLAKRYTNKEIAAELYISPSTVKRHTINIYQKLSVHKRRDAVRAAKELGLILRS